MNREREWKLNEQKHHNGGIMDRFNIVGDGMLDEGRFEEVLKPRSKVGVFSEFVRYVIYLFSFDIKGEK